MKSFWFYFYNIIILPPLKMALYLLSFFNIKIKEGIKGRKRLFEELIINLAGLDRTKNLIWFHSSSMGEFEQAKPIIEKLKKRFNINVLVTFFSPSGYRNSLKYPHAELISYLPFDSAKDIKHFVNLVKPSFVFFMRYDFWPNLVWTLEKNKISFFIVDATMHEDSKRKLPISKQFHSSLFNKFSKILTISDKDRNSFMDFDIEKRKLGVVGDTRFDRVYQKSINAKNKNLFRNEIVLGKKIIVLGSSWEADEEIVLPAIKKIIKYVDDLLIIIAPHEPTPKRLEELEYLLSGIKNIRFSFKNDYTDEKIILIDSIGILLTLYYYADIAYVGGSFRQGVHNVLEPAVYGIPVVFGPKNKNSREAQKMMELGCGIQISTQKEAYRAFRELLSIEKNRANLGKISNDYIQKNIGATEKIIEELS